MSLNNSPHDIFFPGLPFLQLWGLAENINLVNAGGGGVIQE